MALTSDSGVDMLKLASIWVHSNEEEMLVWTRTSGLTFLQTDTHLFGNEEAQPPVQPH